MRKIKFDLRPKYVLHLILIVATLFASYYVGNYLFGVPSINHPIQLFIVMVVTFFLADNFWGSVLNV